VPLIASSAGCF